MKRLLSKLAGIPAASWAAALALAAIAAGFWLAWAPLGLIVPGCIVFGCVSWSYLRGGSPDA